MPSLKLYVKERRNSNLIAFGKNVFKKKKEYLTKKKYY
jgi:hypothetical protein